MKQKQTDMKTIFLSLVALIATCGTALCQTQKIYHANLAKCTMNWTGYAQTGNYAPTGTVRLKNGKIGFKNGKLSSAKLVIDMTSIAHENESLQEHLKKPDFFDTERFPQAVFELVSISGKTGIGKLTLKGITLPVRFQLLYTTFAKQVVVQTTLEIDRTLFGIKYNSSSYFQDLGSYAIKDKFLLAARLEFVSDPSAR